MPYTRKYYHFDIYSIFFKLLTFYTLFFLLHFVKSGVYFTCIAHLHSEWSQFKCTAVITLDIITAQAWNIAAFTSTKTFVPFGRTESCTLPSLQHQLYELFLSLLANNDCSMNANVHGRFEKLAFITTLTAGQLISFITYF